MWGRVTGMAALQQATVLQRHKDRAGCRCAAAVSLHLAVVNMATVAWVPRSVFSSTKLSSAVPCQEAGTIGSSKGKGPSRADLEVRCARSPAGLACTGRAEHE